jgi:hypothetical protein
MDFETWWRQYPRKEGKFPASKRWLKMTEDERQMAFDALPKHIAAWKARGTEPEFIPYGSTWLNQRRYEDEIEMPAAVPKQVVAWWTTEQGVLAKGRELGIQARPGEEMAQYKARLVEAMRRAA